MEIKTGSQVFYKQPLRDPAAGSTLKIGNVVSVQGQRATVHFSAENVRRTVDLSTLQLSSERFKGRSSVPVNPVHRH